MSIRNVAAACGLIVMSATPFAAHAGGPDTAADACIQAFVDTYLPNATPMQIRTLSPVPGPLGVYIKKYTIDLSARLARGGEELVTARCIADANGRVIALDRQPPGDARGGIAAARLK